MKIVTIIGARPQFIKAAIISRELENYKNINEIIIHTGQHYDKNMSEIFFEQLEIPNPNSNLKCGGGSQAEQTASIMIEFEKELIKNGKVDIVKVGIGSGCFDENTKMSLAFAKIENSPLQLVKVTFSLPKLTTSIPESKASSVAIIP